MKIVCIGRNYRAHAQELNNEVPKEPLLFFKPSTAIHCGEKYVLPSFTTDLHYECEWVIRIGKTCKNVSEKGALEVIDSMTLGIDFTARDLQSKLKDQGHPWERAKAFDGSAVIGKWKTFDNNSHKFKLLKNSEIVQEGNIEMMVYSITYLIADISKIFTLEKGDLIFTGTPEGVGPVVKGDMLEGFLNGEKSFLLEIV